MAFEVAPFQKDQIESLLPLVAGYQKFYGVPSDPDRNRAHFLGLPETGGKVFLLWEGAEAVGFATFYFTYSTVRADRLLLLNDLFVVPSRRGEGLGHTLLQGVSKWAWAQGYPKLEWQTAPDNATARRLYDRSGATAETWVHYTLTPDSGTSAET